MKTSSASTLHILLSSFTFSLLFFFSLTGVAMAQTISETLNPVEFHEKLKNETHPFILDVRTPEEFKSGHLDQAENHNIYDKSFEHEIAKLNRNKPVYIYCKSGPRSTAAVKKMQELGFVALYELKGGIMAWEQSSLPLSHAEKAKKDLFSIADFNTMLSKNKYVLVDFYAEWCLPCKKMEPSLLKLKNQFKDKVAVERINVDEAKALSKEIKIEGLPLVVAYKNGVELKRVTGYQSEKELLTLINGLK